MSGIQLNSKSIKTIDYLKKESKTAIQVYGERAKGGVLLITSTEVPKELLRPDFYNDIPDHWRLKWSGHQAELYWIPPEA